MSLPISQRRELSVDRAPFWKNRMSSPAKDESTMNRTGAGYALCILFAINAINFFDRQIGGVLAEPVRKEWGLTDTKSRLAGDCFHAAVRGGRRAAGAPGGSFEPIADTRRGRLFLKPDDSRIGPDAQFLAIVRLAPGRRCGRGDLCARFGLVDGSEDRHCGVSSTSRMYLNSRVW
jgi:hypothetical protein